MNKTLREAVDEVKGHILNQVRFVHPTTNPLYKFDSTLMEIGAEEVTDEYAGQMLEGKIIISDDALVELVGSMGLKTLYDEDAWVDPVADYICEHADDCAALWAHIEQLGRDVAQHEVMLDNTPIN